MKFAPFKGVKKYSFNINTFSTTSLVTLSYDALVFANVYHSNPAAALGSGGFIRYITSGSSVVNQNKRMIWLASYNPTTFNYGQRSFGTFVPAGKTIQQGAIRLAGTVKIDLYVIDLNDQVVDN